MWSSRPVIPATRALYMSPQCARHKTKWSVAATWRYNMTSRVCPPSLWLLFARFLFDCFVCLFFFFFNRLNFYVESLKIDQHHTNNPQPRLSYS